MAAAIALRSSSATSQRLDALRAAGTMRDAEAADLQASFEFLVQMRLRGQVEDIGADREPENCIRLDRLHVMEQGN